MTEADWLTSTDPAAMLASCEQDNTIKGTHVSDRKLRLFAVACCRQVWPLLTDDAPCPECGDCGRDQRDGHDGDCPDCGGTGRVNRLRRAVEVAERFADGEATGYELATASRDAFDVTDSVNTAWVCCNQNPFAPALSRITGGETYPAISPTAQAALLREVCGDPFGPPLQLCGHHSIPDDCPCCQRIRTPAVLALARSAYEERLADGTIDPVTLAVLADALYEAGCTDEAILQHLRGWERCRTCLAVGPHDETQCQCSPGYGVVCDHGWVHNPGAVHVRGCWPVDAILGWG